MSAKSNNVVNRDGMIKVIPRYPRGGGGIEIVMLEKKQRKTELSSLEIIINNDRPAMLSRSLGDWSFLYVK
jgi:hypothetical protein